MQTALPHSPPRSFSAETCWCWNTGRQNISCLSSAHLSLNMMNTMPSPVLFSAWTNPDIVKAITSSTFSYSVLPTPPHLVAICRFFCCLSSSLVVSHFQQDAHVCANGWPSGYRRRKNLLRWKQCTLAVKRLDTISLEWQQRCSWKQNIMQETKFRICLHCRKLLNKNKM